jgi:hypothetical protein
MTRCSDIALARRTGAAQGCQHSLKPVANAEAADQSFSLLTWRILTLHKPGEERRLDHLALVRREPRQCRAESLALLAQFEDVMRIGGHLGYGLLIAAVAAFLSTLKAQAVDRPRQIPRQTRAAASDCSEPQMKRSAWPKVKRPPPLDGLRDSKSPIPP